MLFHPLLLGLVDYSGQDVRKDAELVEVTHFDACVKRLRYLLLVQFENYCDPFHAVAEELWKVVVKVLVNYVQIFFEVRL